MRGGVLLPASRAWPQHLLLLVQLNRAPHVIPLPNASYPQQELQFFLGESGDMEGSMVYAYYKEGSSEPTFLLFKDALKEVKC